MRAKQASIYSVWLKVPLAATIYLLSCSAKMALCLHASFSQSDWQRLFIVNIIECIVWAAWILEQHGKEIGAAFLALPLLFAVYASISVGVLSAGLNVFPFTDTAVRTAMLLQSLMITNLWLFTAVFLSRRKGIALRARVLSMIDSVSVSGGGVFAFSICGVAIAVLYLYKFYSSGAYKLLALSARNRGELLIVMGAGRTWILTAAFAAWLMVSLVLWLSKGARRAMKRPQIALQVAAISIFCSVYLRLGNRRELAQVLILGTTLLLIKGRTRLVMVVVCVALLLGLYVGISRDFASGASDPRLAREIARDPSSFYMDLFSEAIFPNYPLLDHIEEQHPPVWGMTYLRLPGIMSPTFGLWKKPLTLSDEFSQQFVNGSIGFAYTPLGEGYYNFGNAAALITPLMLIAGELFLVQVALSNPRSPVAVLPVLVFLSFSMDIVRGEFVTIATSIVIYTTLASGYLWLCGLGARR